MNTLTLIRIDGVVQTTPVVTHDHLVEFVVTDDAAREFVVRIPQGDLRAPLAAGDHVRARGAEGWVIPGRAWVAEPSRTILQASDVEVAGFAIAA